MRAKVMLICAVACITSMAQTLTGDWSGRLELGGGRGLKLAVHISDSVITLDSPDQGAYGLECSTVFLGADSVNFSIPKLMMNYEGRIADGRLAGIFRQAGVKLPLDFERGVKKANRPQTPQPPYPYSQEEVKIGNLAGTLTIPEGATGATPIAVLVSGSGLQNRDEELFEHKPFAVIADYLARRGIATLRYDDRGCGESTGDASEATTVDFAADAESVVNWTKVTKRFGRIGIIGHSEGGQIAYMLNGPDFIVSIAGPTIKGLRILEYQNKMALIEAGIPETQAAIQAVDATQAVAANPPNKWIEYFVNYDPADDLRKVSVPALLIFGEKDRQVPAELNVGPARELIPAATIKVFPRLNHMMQHAQTGAVSEYAQIEETISEDVLAEIASFCK